MYLLNLFVIQTIYRVLRNGVQQSSVMNSYIQFTTLSFYYVVVLFSNVHDQLPRAFLCCYRNRRMQVHVDASVPPRERAASV